MITHRRRVGPGLVVALALAAGTSGCGDDNPEDSSAPATRTAPAAPATTGDAPQDDDDDEAAAAALDGRVFVASAAEGFTLVDGSRVSIELFDGRFGANGGCNSIGGSSWQLDGGRLVVADLAMTEMACEPAALMDQEAWLVALLTAMPTAAVDGDVLTLTAGAQSLTLRAAS